MKELLDKYISGKKVVILGFGREGRSSYRLIRRYFPNQEITIADKNPGLDISDIDNSDFTTFCLGAHYLDCLSHVDIIFKSPGVFLKHPENAALASKIVTQTSLFLQKYSRQIIGVTGTKGKSTTSSLIHHIFQIAGRKSVFVGNIGVPAFDAIPEIDNGSAIIFELSAHQLEQVKHSPHISILLNVFNEHLDYFKSFGVYSEAKLKIAEFQNSKDYFVFNKLDLQLFERRIKLFKGSKFNFSANSPDKNDVCFCGDKIFSGLIPGIPIDVSFRKLIGKHNLKNILAAVSASLISDISPQKIEDGIRSFQPLAHRLEFVGTYCGIDFVNDSISTIPESTLEALNTVKNVDILILGGFDRGIDYTIIIDYLIKCPVKNILLTGPAGIRIKEMIETGAGKKPRLQVFEDYNELSDIILQIAVNGSTCLLSPAASSYDKFNNFEERGNAFKKMARHLGESCH